MSEEALSGDPADRAAAIVRFDLLSLDEDIHLDGLCALAADLCGTRSAAILLVDPAERRLVGRNGDIPAALLDDATLFDAFLAGRRDTLVIPDAAIDSESPVFSSGSDEKDFRFRAGVPLTTEEDVALGALWVLDPAARAGLTDAQDASLRLIAHAVMDHLALRRARRDENLAARELNASDWRFRTLADTMPQMVWSTRADGYTDYFNARWYEFTGLPRGTSEGAGWAASLHPDDRARAGAAWRHSIETGAPYEIEYRLKRHDGEFRWALGRGLALRDDKGEIERWFGTCTDIHDHKIALEERELISQELSHRIKNIFAVISGLIGLSARASPAIQNFAEALRDRVLALGRAHDFVGPQGHRTPSGEPEHSLHGLLREIFAPYEAESGGRIAILGDDVVIDDRSATPLALTFHEVVTNAAKYGALSVPDGRVTLSVGHEDGTISLSWEERGGPTVTGINPSGFGSRLLDLSVRRQLGGRYEQLWDREGLTMRLYIPETAFSRQSA